jgi:hypothetical protein
MEKMRRSLLQWSTCNEGKTAELLPKLKKLLLMANFFTVAFTEKLSARKMLVILKTILTEAVKVVNFVKPRATNSRLFSILCNAVASEHDVLPHTKVRWLSQRNVLSCLFQLRSEVQLFLSDTTSDLSNRFTDEMWFSGLAYLADIFCHFSKLNKS